MLDLIQHRLAQAGVRCVKMDGSMSVAARDRVINAFREDPHVTVFLISLKAGGVALNLTAASRIYLMDPWWNPAAEVCNACVTTTGSYCLVPSMHPLLVAGIHNFNR
jgi:DNA repair protein RAD16